MSAHSSSSTGSSQRTTASDPIFALAKKLKRSAGSHSSHSSHSSHPTNRKDHTDLGVSKRQRTSLPLTTPGRAMNADSASSSSSRASSSATPRPQAQAPARAPPPAHTPSLHLNLTRPPRPSQPYHTPRTSLRPNQLQQTPATVISLLDTDDSDSEPATQTPQPRRRSQSRRSQHVPTGRRRQGPLEIEVIDLCSSDDGGDNDGRVAHTPGQSRTVEVIVLSDSDDEVEIVSEKGPDPAIVRRREKLRAVKLEAELATDLDPLRSTDPSAPRPAPPPPAAKPAAPDLPPVKPVIVNGKEEWAVSEIVDSKLVWTTTKHKKKPSAGKAAKTRERAIMYQVEWVGFAGEPTWEPLKHLANCRDLIEKYHLENPGKPKL